VAPLAGLPLVLRSLDRVPFLFGLLAGIGTALLTVLVEHSRIAFGPFALYGNGAFAVPAVAVPLALYLGWTSVAGRRAGRPWVVALALYTLGLHLGIGVWSPLEVLLYPQDSGARLGDAIPGLLLQGVIWVAPPALLAALVWWIYTKVPVNPLTLAAGYLIGMPFALVFGIVTMGTLAGTAVAHGLHVTTSHGRSAVAVLLVVLALAATFVLPELVLRPR